MQVLTTKGLVEMDLLSVKDVVEIGDNHRKVASEFYLDGELVRRDVAVSMLRGLGSEATHGQIG